MTVALLATGVRCIVTYMIVPGVARVLGSADAVAGPVGLVLYALCVGTAARAAWSSASAGRWPAATVATLLACLNLVGLLAAITG